MRPRTQPDGLKSLNAAAKRHRTAERALHEEMFRSHRAGSSLRTIATVTGISHESVRVIVERVAKWAEREQELVRQPLYGGFTYQSRDRAEREREQRVKHLNWLLAVKESDE